MAKVREATVADAALISMLNADVQKRHADALPHIFKQPSADTFPPATIVELIADPRHRFFLAMIDEEAVGYVWAEIRHRPEDGALFARNTIMVHHISVKPMHQHNGHGERLLAAVKGLAQEAGIATIQLDTWSFNAEAQRFFKRQGFSIFNYRLWTEVA